MAELKKTIMIVAGEASGDSHAAKLCSAIRELDPNTEFRFFGSAGPKMRDAGVERVVRADELSIVGLIEIGRALPMFISAFRRLKRAASERQPDVVVLVDFPDFNLKLARALKNKGYKIVCYISPQIWAWRQYRMRSVRKYIDLLLTILPFEKDWYAERGIHHVEYVGNPVASEVHPDSTKESFCRRHGLDPEARIITMLPGSRHKEIVRILPEMLRAAAVLMRKDREIQFIVAFAAERHRNEFEAAQAKISEGDRILTEKIKVVSAETYDALFAADAAAVTSGTATLETGIIGTPMAIVYKTSVLNYRLLRPLIDVEHFGLINLIGGDRIASELIQDDFTPGTLADELSRILEPETNSRIRKQLKVAADKLGQGGASKRAAAAILNLIG